MEGRGQQKDQTHTFKTDLILLRKAVHVENELSRQLGLPHLLFSAEEPEAQKGSEVTELCNNLVLPD